MPSIREWLKKESHFPYRNFPCSFGIWFSFSWKCFSMKFIISILLQHLFISSSLLIKPWLIKALFLGPLTTSFSANPDNGITSFVRNIRFLLTVLVDIVAALWYDTGLLGLWLMPRWNVELPPRLNIAGSSWAGLSNRRWFLPVLEILLPKGLVTFVLRLSVWWVAEPTELLGCELLPDKITFIWFFWTLDDEELYSQDYSSFPQHSHQQPCFPEILLSFKHVFFKFLAYGYDNAQLSCASNRYLKYLFVQLPCASSIDLRFLL